MCFDGIKVPAVTKEGAREDEILRGPALCLIISSSRKTCEKVLRFS